MTEKKYMLQYIRTFIKGMLMGAADIVPGVSGGTMAFITGIYERLINAIYAIDFSLLTLIKQGKRKQLRSSIDGTFLFSLFGGIIVSILIFSGLLSQGLELYPHLMYALFAGLIIASAEMIYPHVTQRNRKKYLIGIVAIGIGVLITQLTPTQIQPTYLMVFLSAAIAICAMILPGISGSFILLLLGMYEPVINAIHEREIVFVLVFALGAIVGLLSFVRLVKHMFDRHHDMTIAALIGLMLGSLPKLRPRAHTEFAYSCPTTTPRSTIIPIVIAFVLGYIIVRGVSKYSTSK